MVRIFIGLFLLGSSDSLCVENLLAELKSVAIEWKIFRNVKQCNCAMPFEPYNKKVKLHSGILNHF